MIQTTPNSSPVPPPPAEPETLISRMTDVTRSRAFAGETVDEETLAQHGFTSDEIAGSWQTLMLAKAAC